METLSLLPVRSPATMPPTASFFVFFIAFYVFYASAHPTIYMKNNEDTLSPVLVPVSSTVVPMTVYKVAPPDGANPDPVYDDSVKLITVKTKKKAKSKALVKTLTREDFEKAKIEV